LRGCGKRAQGKVRHEEFSEWAEIFPREMARFRACQDPMGWELVRRGVDAVGRAREDGPVQKVFPSSC